MKTTQKRLPRRVLAVGAHPDDIEFGAGGTLLKHVAAGDYVNILVLTSGESGGEAPEVRKAEAERAGLFIGAVTTDVGSLPDTRVQEKDAIDAIEAAVANYKPHIAYIHSAHDTHQDHRAAAYAARVALRGARKLYAYQAPSATGCFEPQRFTDISMFIDGKLRAIGFHASQAGKRRYLENDYVMATGHYWGVQAGDCDHAEAFEVVFDRDYAADAF